MSADESFLSRWSRRKRGGDAVRDTARDTARREQRAYEQGESEPLANPAVEAPSATHAQAPERAPVGAKSRAQSATQLTAPPTVQPSAQSLAQPAAQPSGLSASAHGPKSVAPAEPAEQPLPSIESLRPDSDFTPFMKAGIDPSTRASALRRLFADPHFNQMDGLDIYIDDYGKPDPIPLAMLKAMNQARGLGLFSNAADETAVESEGSSEPVRSTEAGEPNAAGANDGAAQSADPPAGAAQGTASDRHDASARGASVPEPDGVPNGSAPGTRS